MSKVCFLVLMVLHLTVSVTAQAPWVPDLGTGQYKNPVLFADYSDPDVIRIGDDFYMVASSFNCMPGIPVLHSKDLDSNGYVDFNSFRIE